jgi:hypothetical protein
MFHRSFPRAFWIRKGSSFGTSLLVLLLLAACSGSNDSTVKHSQTPLASPKSSPTAPGASSGGGGSPPPSGSDSNGPVDFNVTGLHINSTSIGCPANEFGIGHGELVLAQDRLIYSDAEIAQMQAYLAAPPAGPLPSTLQWAPVGGVGEDTPSSYKYVQPGCGAKLEITNIGQSTVQIPQVELQLRAPPQPNTSRYSLVDSCTISTATCPIGFGGGPDCLYRSSITLNSKAAGSRFTSSLVGTSATGAPCPATLTLDPGQTQDVLLQMYSTGTPANLDYSLLPQLTMITTAGTQVIDLSPMAATVNFASNDQFSCYGLRGNTFMLTEQGAACGDTANI